MWDGRESSPATGTPRSVTRTIPASLLDDLAHQSVDATTGHAQGDGSRPTPAEQEQIVNFEMALFTAQAIDFRAGSLNASGAAADPNAHRRALLHQHQLQRAIPRSNVGAARRFQDAGDGFFFGEDLQPVQRVGQSCRDTDQRAAIARGQALFNSKPINITGCRINDDAAEGGLVAGGMPQLVGTCGTCHDTPGIGNHSFPTALNIGTGDFEFASSSGTWAASI